MDIPQTYKKVVEFDGLGNRYLQLLEEKANVICQVDITTGITESNGSVRNRAIQLANGMRSHGVMENSIIVIASKSHCDQTIAVLASLFIGAIVAPVFSELPLTEIQVNVKKLKPKIIFCDVRSSGMFEKAVAETKVNCKVVVFDKSHPTTMVFNKLLLQDSGEPFKPVSVRNSKGTVAFILSTQGTTDDSKLVCISHQSILYQTMSFMRFIELPNVILSHFPLSWIVEVILMCSAFEHPITRILHMDPTPRHTCKMIQDMRVDYAFITTLYAQNIVNDAAVKDFSLTSLKCFFVGGCLTSAQTMQAMRQQLPKVKFSQFYASTEGGIIAVTPHKDYSLSLDQSATAGKVLPGMKLKIVDSVSGDSLGCEKMGEIVVASEGVMLGYYHDPGKALSVMQKHYLRTGDLGYVDSQGWVFVCGRESDVYYVEGEKVLPGDLEDLILSHPFVKSVAVVGYDANLIAFIVALPGTNLTSEKMIKYIEERDEEIKVPNKIIFPTSFPLTPLGNIRRGPLRQQVGKVKIVHTTSMASLDNQ